MNPLVNTRVKRIGRDALAQLLPRIWRLSLASVALMHHGRPLVAGFGVTETPPVQLVHSLAGSPAAGLAEPVPAKVAPSTLPSMPAAVLLVVTLPVRVAVLQVTLPREVVMTVSPTLVAVIAVPGASTVPVGCVSTGLAEAVDAIARAAKAAIAMQAAMSFFDM